MYPPSLVSGPINIVRLEGSVGNVTKILYLYFDFHMPLQTQTECEDAINSLPIVQHLISMFKECYEHDPNKKYHLFAEYHPFYKPSLINYGKSEIHIINVVKLVKNIFSINKDNMKIIRKNTEDFHNVYFHYTDFRKVYFPPEMDTLTNLMFNVTYAPECCIMAQQILLLKNGLEVLNKFTTILYQTLIKGVNLYAEIDSKTMIDQTYNLPDYFVIVMRDFIKKIRDLYQNPSIKEGILNILSMDYGVQIEKRMQKLLNFIQESNKFIENPILQDPRSLYLESRYRHNSISLYRKGGRTDEDMKELLNYKIATTDLIWDVFSDINLMDIYVLRRFLDKTYVGTGIFYSGADHSVNVIRYLVKYFGFTVTHASYHSGPLDKINQEIKQSTSYENLHDYFFPKVDTQCSDMSTFPKFYE